jgi:hypothetical protein
LEPLSQHFLKGLNKTMKTKLILVDVPAEIWIGFPRTNQKPRHLA